MELLECKPLSARISRTTCESNKKRGTFACEKCDGLLNKNESSVSNKTVCNIRGCEKWAQIKGMCKTHYNKSLLQRTSALDDATERKEVVSLTVCGTPLPAVSQHEKHIVNLLDMFKQKQAADLVNFAEKLSALKTPSEKLKFALTVLA